MHSKLKTNIFHNFLFIAISLNLSFNDGFCQPAFTAKPLLLEQKIAGNFGELRGNHFHSGIDYKTNEEEGQPVLACGNGYISRIKVSSTGFGRAIYINHPNGITTVYGHLSAFSPPIEEAIRELQYKKEEFEVEWFPDSSLFPVTEGQLIGFSGNSGSAEGPHLHFETRNTTSETPFNPEIAGFTVSDTIPPIIKSIVFYQPGPAKGLFGATRFMVKTDSLSHQAFTDTLHLPSQFFVGFSAFDLAGQEKNELGIRKFDLSLDDSLIYSCKVDSFSFDESRMVNAFIDFPFAMDSDEVITLCYKLPGNKLSICKNNGSGLVAVKDTKAHSGRLTLSDTNGNKTTVDFIFKSLPNKISNTQIHGIIIDSTHQGIAKSVNYEIHFPANCFYEKVGVKVSKIVPSLSKISETITIDAGNLPVNKPFQLKMKSVVLLNKLNSSKALIVKTDKHNLLIPAGTTSYKDGWFSTSTRETGKFIVVLDTVAPNCNSTEMINVLRDRSKKIRIHISDNISGIQKANIYCNDKWVLSEFNSSKNFVEVGLNEFEGISASTFKVHLIDKMGNQSVTEFQIPNKP